ncbi:hypothetical protein J8F10_19920 [Gemmata sp. G18]|uniref:Uncharacterized protein n=1 Tax=Gemmata palustris TaxID=2822762 RepID=A0ABS5BV33_9BACT|nr:hypothetical protein [Gemmata palustris]MBP3957521.1 hypothetical protein [Gemmata palustris]
MPSPRLLVMAHWLFLPDDAIGDIAVLVELTPKQFDLLRNYLDSNEFRPRYAFYTAVADLLGISDESAARLCTFINHVQAQRAKFRHSGSLVPGELESFLQRAVKGKEAEKAKRLLDRIKSLKDHIVKLFSDLPNRDHSVKVRGLESGPLPHLRKFRTFCDLRPVYDAAANKIVQYLPIITLSLTTHRAESDAYEEVVIQLAEGDLAEFQEQFQRLTKKLTLLKEEYTFSDDTQEGDES